MVQVRVKVENLLEGCILSEDVNCRTNRPIIPKNTILKNDLIEILHAFLIKDVQVKNTLVNGEPFIPSEVLEDKQEVEESQARETQSKDTQVGLSEYFLEAVKEYKKEFRVWQSGIHVDIIKVREIILRLIEKAESRSSEVFTLHHYSTKEEYLYQHSIAVGLLSGLIGKKLNYNKGDIIQLALAGCLSDCGMAKIKDGIINKTSTLTYSEFEEIKKHPIYSYQMIQNSSLIRESVKVSIIQHHERLDGSGYPFGEKDQRIHPFAKIIAVADTFHAMTSERQYRNKQSPFKVLEMMIQDNFGKFDLIAIKALRTELMNLSIGNKVKLSNGQIAEIVFMDDKSPTRPLIKLMETEDIIHLGKFRDLYIEEILTL